MSNQEKGEIMKQLQDLPPQLQAQAEAFARGLAAGARCVYRADSKPALEDTRASEAGKEAQKDG